MISEIKQAIQIFTPNEISIGKDVLVVKVTGSKRYEAHEEIKKVILSTGINFQEKKTSLSKNIPTLIFDDKVKLVVKPIGLSNNKGIKFETEFKKNLESFIRERNTIEPFEQLETILNKPLISQNVNQVCKKKNNSRPLISDADGFIVGGIGSIGNVISDIDIKFADGSIEHLSLKKGNNTTFCNIGIRKIFLEQEIKNNSITNPTAIEFLNFLKVDPKLFCDVFNLRNSGYKNNLVVESEWHLGLQRFLKSAIGYGYIYIHKINEKYTLKDWRTPDFLEDLTTIKSYKIRYPIGMAKTLHILIETQGAFFDLNIRNKHSGLYPNEMMLNYKFK